jgi:heparin binding hemagglutinin HbhA
MSAPEPNEVRATTEPMPPAEPPPTARPTPPVESTPTARPMPAVEPAPNPLLAVLGAGDAAMAAVSRAFADAFSAATATRESMQQRVADLPHELEALRSRFSGEELRHALEAYREQVERAYAQVAGRGEEAWGRLREQPQVRQALTAFEGYTDKLDARVDDAQDAATRALRAAGWQTRVTGEKAAQAGQRLTDRAADVVVDASAAASEAVEEAGVAAAEAIEDAGDEAAAATRATTRKAAPGSTAPRRTRRTTAE